MTRKDLTEVVLVVDRSGSMQSVRADAEGGINELIKEQKDEPNECNFTLIQFDTEYEFVHQGVPIKDVGEFRLHPRGMTALLDAVGKGISQTGERLAKMDEKDRPGLVIFVIVTDGLENSSREYSREQIKQMIETQQNEFSWKFSFLGANIDAFGEGRGIGVQSAGIAQYAANSKGTDAAFKGTSGKVKRMRAAAASGQSVRGISNSYTDEELEAMKGE